MSDLNYVVLFDGVCNLCNSIVKFVLIRDKFAKIKFASLQSETGQMLLAQNNLPIENFSSFVYFRKEKLLQKSTAGLFLFSDLGGLWKIILIFWIVPFFIRDWIYLLISKNRYRLFGKRESCMLPSPEWKSRFL
jgi:predicted DCC family thiol-disulfide oxidoreductase YuxK